MARRKSKKRKLTERIVTTRDRFTYAGLGNATTFRALAIGSHFRFTDDRTGQPYGQPVKKVSANCYVRAVRDVIKSRVRSAVQPICFRAVSAGVVPTGRRSPVRKRRGRGRGTAVLSGYRRTR